MEFRFIADINVGKNNNSRPLHGAAFYDCPEIVKLLIEQGADIEAANASGYTPLMSAAAAARFAASPAQPGGGHPDRSRDVCRSCHSHFGESTHGATAPVSVLPLHRIRRARSVLKAPHGILPAVAWAAQAAPSS